MLKAEDIVYRCI